MKFFQKNTSRHLAGFVVLMLGVMFAGPASSQANIMSEGEIRRACVYGDCQNGFGILEIRTDVGTDRYEGSFADGMFHGAGRYEQMISSTGRSYYDGDWTMGARDGRGTYWNGVSSLYIGQWRNDYRHGQGSYFFGLTDWVPNRHTEAWLRENVENYTGDFVDDLYQGHGTYRWPDGQRYVGTFYANEKHGPGTFFYPRGTRREQEWEYGRFVR
ncbi:MAG: hypothetical protein Q8K97_04330 [Pseudohongiella sp.]|nr:hypothetical protein [Pseudohongiella sp.]